MMHGISNKTSSIAKTNTPLNDGCMSETTPAAARHVQRDLLVISTPSGAKARRIRNWPQLRRSSPRFHLCFRTSSVPKLQKFIGVAVSALVNIRSEVEETVVPGSIHPSGEDDTRPRLTRRSIVARIRA